MSETFNNLINTMAKIINSEELRENFKKMKTLEEIFYFCKEYGFAGNFHEFEIEITKLLAYSIKKTSEEELSKVSGGSNKYFIKSSATFLSALTLSTSIIPGIKAVPHLECESLVPKTKIQQRNIISSIATTGIGIGSIVIAATIYYLNSKNEKNTSGSNTTVQNQNPILNQNINQNTNQNINQNKNNKKNTIPILIPDPIKNTKENIQDSEDEENDFVYKKPKTIEYFNENSKSKYAKFINKDVVSIDEILKLKTNDLNKPDVFDWSGVEDDKIIESRPYAGSEQSYSSKGEYKWEEPNGKIFSYKATEGNKLLVYKIDLNKIISNKKSNNNYIYLRNGYYDYYLNKPCKFIYRYNVGNEEYVELVFECPEELPFDCCSTVYSNTDSNKTTETSSLFTYDKDKIDKLEGIEINENTPSEINMPENCKTCISVEYNEPKSKSVQSDRNKLYKYYYGIKPPKNHFIFVLLTITKEIFIQEKDRYAYINDYNSALNLKEYKCYYELRKDGKYNVFVVLPDDFSSFHSYKYSKKSK